MSDEASGGAASADEVLTMLENAARRLEASDSLLRECYKALGEGLRDGEYENLKLDRYAMPTDWGDRVGVLRAKLKEALGD